MPRALARAALLVAVPLLSLTACTSVPGEHSDEITRFHVDTTVLPDGSVEVTETITYDFGTEPGSGLWREMPTTVRESFLRRRVLEVTDVEVTSPSGAPAEIEEQREWRGWLELEVGDEDDPVTGEQTYEFSYTVQGALTQDNGYTEFHWDFVGDRWGVPVRDVRATVEAPQLGAAECYYLRTVYYGDDEEETREEACDAEYDATSATLTHDELQPDMPLSGVVQIPDGAVEVADASYTLPSLPRWLTLVGVLSLVAALAVCYGLIRFGSWVDGLRSARRTFPGKLPDIPPALAGFLHRKEKLRPEHVLAVLVRLEEKGHVSSVSGGNGWVFTRRESAAETTPSERALLSAMFGSSGESDLPRLSRGLTKRRVRRLERALVREGRQHGLIRPGWMWGPAATLALVLFFASFLTPLVLNEYTPLDLEGLTAFSSALPPVTVVLLLLPGYRTPYGEHVRTRLAATAGSLSKTDPVLAVALGASPDKLTGGGADVRYFYRDREYRDRWNKHVNSSIRRAHVTRGGGGGGGSAGSGGGGGGGGRR